MTLPFKFEACPNRNVCSVTVPDGGMNCGTSPEHLQPMPLAENLCSTMLMAALDNERRFKPDPRYPKDQAENDYRLGCFLFEAALHPETSATHAEDYFEEGISHLTAAKTIVDARPRTVIDSSLMNANLPFFEARKFGYKVTDDTFDAVRAEVADIGTFAFGVEQEDVMLGGLIKVGMHLLVLRQGITCYASTFRELCSARRASSDTAPAQTEYAHSGYLIENVGDTTQKIPLRTNHAKRNVTVNPHIVGLPMAHIVRKAFAAGAPEALEAFPGRVEATLHLIGWAMDETRAPLESHQTATLDAASDGIMVRVDAKYPEIKA